MVQVVSFTGWPGEEYCEMLEPALELGGEMSSAEMCDAVHSGKMQMWLVYEGATLLAVVLTEVIDYPQLSALRVIAIGGVGMSHWQQALFDTFKQYCILWNVSRIETVCRPGLERIMKPLGFEKRLVCLMKEIDNGQVSRNS
jgi:hypothetical protein